MIKDSLLTGDVYYEPTTGFFIQIPLNELEDYLEEEHTHYQPIPDHELLKIYPQAKSIIKEQLKFIKRKLCNNAELATYSTNETLNSFLEEMKEERRLKLLEEIKRLERMLAPFDSKQRGNKLDIQKAKQFPIENLLNIRGGNICCLWHKEKTPSLHLNKKENTLYCFGSCGKMFDVIDVYQKLTGCSFLDSVKKLS